MNRSWRFFPRLLPGLSVFNPEDEEGRLSNCGLCLARLAFVGDANDGLLLGVVRGAFPEGMGMRLGVFNNASIDIGLQGEVSRRLGDESAIENIQSLDFSCMFRAILPTLLICSSSGALGVDKSLGLRVCRVGRDSTRFEGNKCRPAMQSLQHQHIFKNI